MYNVLYLGQLKCLVVQTIMKHTFVQIKTFFDTNVLEKSDSFGFFPVPFNYTFLRLQDFRRFFF